MMMKTTKAQVKKMINAMETRQIGLKDDLNTKNKEIEIPLQTLFDTCLSYVSVEEAFKDFIK